MTDSMFKAPSVHPFVECPNCRHLLEYGAQRCHRCREEIDSDYALLSAVIVHRLTQAISLANTIKGMEPAVFISIGVSIYIYLVGVPALFTLTFLMPVICLVVVLGWFFRFGRLRVADEEYLKAKREMGWLLKLWLGVLMVQALVLLYMLKTTTPAS